VLALAAVYVNSLNRLWAHYASVARVGAEFLFKGGRCEVRMNGKVCMVGISVDGGLYVVDQEHGQQAMLAKTHETAELWHQRFSHLSYGNLERLVAEKMVKGIQL
jgi:hypothetical protein